MSISSVVGQDKAVAKLQQALLSGRVPHGYIFHGPEGVGKAFCAKEFGKIILCEDPKRQKVDGQAWLDCCDSCPSCGAVEADTHPDYHLVYRQQIQELQGETSSHKATTLAVKVIREKLSKLAQLTSNYGRGKVFVVREMHLAAVPAQNALLKTLEEPPDGTILILLADQLEGLLPTILSRCQMVMFGPLPQEFLLEKLQQAGYELAESLFWACFADGSLGRALWLARQQWYEVKVGMVERLARLGRNDVVELAELVLDLTKAYAKEVRKTEPAISETVARQRMYAFLLGVASGFYRDLMLCGSGSAPGEWINADQEPAIRQGVQMLGMLEASRAVELICRAEYLIQKNVNANLVFEDLFGDLARMNCKAPVA